MRCRSNINTLEIKYIRSNSSYDLIFLLRLKNLSSIASAKWRVDEINRMKINWRKDHAERSKFIETKSIFTPLTWSEAHFSATCCTIVEATSIRSDIKFLIRFSLQKTTPNSPHQDRTQFNISQVVLFVSNYIKNILSPSSPRKNHPTHILQSDRPLFDIFWLIIKYLYFTARRPENYRYPKEEHEQKMTAHQSIADHSRMKCILVQVRSLEDLRSVELYKGEEAVVEIEGVEMMGPTRNSFKCSILQLLEKARIDLMYNIQHCGAMQPELAAELERVNSWMGKTNEEEPSFELALIAPPPPDNLINKDKNMIDKHKSEDLDNMTIQK